MAVHSSPSSESGGENTEYDEFSSKFANMMDDLIFYLNTYEVCRHKINDVFSI